MGKGRGKPCPYTRFYKRCCWQMVGAATRRPCEVVFCNPPYLKTSISFSARFILLFILFQSTL